MPGKRIAALVGAFLLVLAVTCVIAVLLAVLVAAISPGPFKDSFRTIVDKSLLAALPVGAIGPLMVKGLSIERTRSAPEGDEEFETLFGELVSAVGGERLVVFIDELDRCAPEEVASTLETLRTFLDVKGCVFIVAADQQVLE